MTTPGPPPPAPGDDARPEPDSAPADGAGASDSLTRRVGGAFVLVSIGVFVGFPLLFSDATTTTIAVYALIFMVATASWNTFSGFSGYLALGHAAFFGTGAYAVALAAQDWHVPGGWDVFALLPFAGLVAGLAAIPVGLVALRTRRHTFVVVTIAIFFIFQLAAFNLAFTGETSGISLPIAPFAPSTYNLPFYYVALAILILTVAFSWGLRRSRFGLQLLAIRDDEDRARGLGVKVGRVKLTSFVLSAIPVGMVGGLYAYFLGQVFPQFAFDPLFDVSIALMGFLGGLGTLVGPLLGALVLETLQQYFTLTYSGAGVYLIAYGVLFLVVILLLPRGVVPGLGDLFRWWRARTPGRPTDEGAIGVAGAPP
jgi:branched-chain amino acid transport system permease protein